MSNPFDNTDETSNAPNQWVIDAIKRAKESALPLFAETMAVEVGVDAVDLVDAIEAALITGAMGEPTEEKLRNALRSVAESYALAIGARWEMVADVIIAMLEWVPPDESTWTLDSWNLKRRR
jgi:hypothetical protein